VINDHFAAEGTATWPVR